MASRSAHRVVIDEAIDDDRLQLFDRLIAAQQRIAGQLDRELTERLELSIVWFYALEHLGRAPNAELALSDLSSKCGLSLAGGSRLAARLEATNYITRTRSTEDKRVWFAQLTDEGARILNSAVAIAVELIDREMFEPLSSSERWLLDRALTTLAAAERKPKNPTIEAIRERRAAAREQDKEINLVDQTI
jgi:DNA-binding MarR family transcriptional regulator